MPIYNKFDYITIDNARIDETCNAYFKWKDLNTYISNNSRRGINIPDAISEPMGCYCLNYAWNRGQCVGDATNPETGEKIEFKATSRFEGDLSSFGPKCQFDNLVFLRFKIDDNLLYIYKYGNIPQNRERIYIVAFKDKEIYRNFIFPNPIPLEKNLTDIIDFQNKVDEKYYYRAGKYKGNIYEKLVEAIDDENAIYQWRRIYVRKNKSGVVPTLTANQGEGGHNVCIIKTASGIRKMTPHECFNTQGFPKDFKLPYKMSDTRLYKQAGNSVCVSVIKEIAKNITYAYNMNNR